MKVNFDIENNHALLYNDIHLDLHNNFDFIGFSYDVLQRQLIFRWVKAIGDWTINQKYDKLVLIHKKITFMKLVSKDEDSNESDETTLGEVTFSPSSLRDINDSMAPQTKPNYDDDIIYFFETGETMRINCDEIELICE